MQAIGNVNALPALIGDMIYEPSDYLFQMPVEPEAFPRAGDTSAQAITLAAALRHHDS
jgi:hypothetical protein